MPKPNDVPKPGDVWIGSLSRGDVVFAEYVVATLARPDGGGFPDRVSFVAPAGWVAVGDLESVP